MGSPCLLVDNVFNTRIYPGHVITALENSADGPLVGAARRSVYDAYNSATTNAEAWVKVNCGISRGADMIVVDRGHNQGGKTAKAQVADDDFVSPPQDAFTSVTPSAPGAGFLDDALGVRTWEGAWLKRFVPRAGQYWRYDVPALGAGLVATVPGLWIGLCWRPGFVDRPLATGQTTLVVEETQSDQGWLGRGKAVPRRQGVLHFSFISLFDAELAIQHLQHYAAGRRMWIVTDDERAEDAFLAVCPQDAIGEILPLNRFYPTLDIPYLEADPNG